MVSFNIPQILLSKLNICIQKKFEIEIKIQVLRLVYNKHRTNMEVFFNTTHTP